MNQDLLNEVVFALLKHDEADLAKRVVQNGAGSSLEDLVVGTKAGAPKKGRRKLSAAARLAISQAAKRRWQKQKAQEAKK